MRETGLHVTITENEFLKRPLQDLHADNNYLLRHQDVEIRTDQFNP